MTSQNSQLIHNLNFQDNELASIKKTSHADADRNNQNQITTT